MAKNVYIHIPFCKQKCNYCSFISFPHIDKKIEYLTALKQEIKHFYKNENLNTLYFGGGTPSLLTPDEIESILKLFNISKNTEITIELNPETITEKYLKELYKIGINRLSIGCQTFDNNILEIIGRKHTAQQAKNIVKIAQKSGFKNISLDFIYGLPNQSIQNFENDLKEALKLNIQHISLYGLKIDEGCYFYKNIPENLPDNDTQADMYLLAIEILKDFGQYEISNFGKASKHNLNYWDNNFYYGFGVAAHGYINGIRYSNYETIDEYVKNPIKHFSEIKITKQAQLEEEIFLGLRKCNGIDVKKINSKYNIDFEFKYKNILNKYKDFFIKTSEGYALNTNGFLISNNIMSEFIE